MVIAGLGTATPLQRYTQTECWQALQNSPRFEALAPRSRAILRKVLNASNGIKTRHLALDNLDDAFQLTPDALQERYLTHAPRLACEAATRALADSGVRPREIDAVLVSTCTGYLCPGLTSYVIERLDLRPQVLALDLVGQGCGAALPNMRTAESLLASGRCERVLSICVEVCSAAFYLDDDAGVLISACLFGDGAGAAVLSSEPGLGRGIAFEAAGSFMEPQERDSLKFEQRKGMLRNVLLPKVPQLAARAVNTVLTDMEARMRISREAISVWILHPGGRDVLVELGRELNLTPEQLELSAGVLRRYGNLSSPSVFFVLQEALKTPRPGGPWWMSAFGAGFACYGALLRVE